MGSLPFQDVLPVELVAEVLEYLPVKGLWIAARVSRQFYAAAWLAGLFIHRNIQWTAASGHAHQLAMFKDVLEHARRKDLLRISLSLTCSFRSHHDSRERAELYAAAQAVSDELFSAISAALPFLVYLSIQIPDHFRPQLDGALRFPAPRLRALGMYRMSSYIPCVLPIPRHLFAGSAPLLRTLRLGTVTLPEAAIPAFRSVEKAALTYDNLFPYINYHEQLPSLNSLDLEFTISDRVHAALPSYANLRGLPLRHLVIDNGNRYGSTVPLLDAVGRSVDLSTIPVVLVVGYVFRWDERIWTEDNAGLSMRLTNSPDAPEEHNYLLVNVLPAHRRWRRLYQLNYWDLDDPVPILEVPHLPARLTYLRIDAWVVSRILDLALSFDALRDLQIDLHGRIWESSSLQPPDYDDTVTVSAFSETVPRVWAPCPSLEEITLFALREPVMDIDSRHIAFLAHALGQLGRRAVLTLVGVELAEPVAHTLLAQTVSTVRMRAFAGRSSPEDFDGGLWDCELFNRDLRGAYNTAF